jgi:hypothetical protein
MTGVNTMIVCAVLLVYLLGSVAQTPGNVPKYALEYRLNKIGKGRGSFFTVENLRISEATASLPSPAHGRNRLAHDSKVKAVEADGRIRALKAEIPSLEFGRTPETAATVVHAIDNQSGMMKSPLDEVLSNFEFSGTVAELIRALRQRGIRIALEPGGIVGDPFLSRHDDLTHTQVKAHNMTVRDILSNFLPLQNYSHVLWVARTATERGEIMTYIRFLGPEVLESHPKR